MDYSAIIREIDGEIEKLLRARQIIADLAVPVRGGKPPSRRVSVEARTHPAPTAPPQPRVVIVPPRRPREYRRRVQQPPPVPIALGPAPTDRPVVVNPPRPETVMAKLREVPIPVNTDLETAIRRNLLGGAASAVLS